MRASRRCAFGAITAPARNIPTADDVALFPHMSGITSRPKIVPLLHSNVATSAQHIRGLIAAVAASLASGAAIWWGWPRGRTGDGHRPKTETHLIDGTGDQRDFDSDGDLHLTGRLKEIINRGGEKISPLEVDGILLDHPDMAQAVTFARPHSILGKEVVATLVPKDAANLTDQILHGFAIGHVADFKVPRKITIMDQIPKGATGSMQRIWPVETLGLVKTTHR